MKILVVHEVSYKNKVVYEYQDFAERLVKLGHQVTVIDFDEHGDGKYEEASFSRTGLATVNHITTPFVNLPMFKYITARHNYKKILKKLIEKNKVQVVLLYSVFINGTNTVRICNKLNIPVVYRVLDIYHKLRENPLIMIPLYLGERYIYSKARVICVTNEILEKYVMKLSGNYIQDRIVTLHHGVDTNFFSPMEKNSARLTQHEIKKDDKVIVFIGTIYSFCGLDVIVKHFPKLLKLIPNLKLIIVGHGDLAEQLREHIKSNQLNNSIFITGFRPYNEVPEYISCADLTILPFYTNDITKDIIPIKILQYLSSKKPLLCTPLPEVIRLFPENISGIVYASIDKPEEFIGKISSILLNNELQKKLSENAIQFIKQHFDIEIQINKLQNILYKAIEGIK